MHRRRPPVVRGLRVAIVASAVCVAAHAIWAVFERSRVPSLTSDRQSCLDAVTFSRSDWIGRGAGPGLASLLVQVLFILLVSTLIYLAQLAWCWMAYSYASLLTCALLVPCIAFGATWLWVRSPLSSLTPLDWLARWVGEEAVWSNQVAQRVYLDTRLPRDLADIIGSYAPLPSTPLRVLQERQKSDLRRLAAEQRHNLATLAMSPEARRDAQTRLREYETDLGQTRLCPLFGRTVLSLAINASLVGAAATLALTTVGLVSSGLAAASDTSR